MKIHIPLLSFFVLSFNSQFCFSQNKNESHSSWFSGKKIYVTWGYNRDWYTKSNIRFVDKADGNYDFTLYHARAVDKPDQSDLLRRPPTVPQYDINAGIIINAKKGLGLELSWNHLKYVMLDNQTLRLKGKIGNTVYDMDTIVTRDLVHFEHTNGNNYLRVSGVKFYTLLSNKKSTQTLHSVSKFQAGVLWPKTYSLVLGKENDGPFRPSGFVVGISQGLRYNVFKYFFLQTDFDFSYAAYTNAKLYKAGRARHRFFSLQYIWSAGFSIPL